MTPDTLPDLGQAPPALLVDLHRALTAENLSFATFALMLAAFREQGPVTVARLSVLTGASYHAARNQIRRTPWFTVRHDGPLVAVQLTPDGHTKVLRVGKRLDPV